MGIVYLADDTLLSRQVAIKTIELAVDDAVALHGRAWIYLRRGAFYKSLADFNESIRLSPDNVPAYRGPAAARRGLGDRQGAQADEVKYEQLSTKKGGYTEVGHALACRYPREAHRAPLRGAAAKAS
jgi:tetratricopeptide (TPR) repeat protein